MKLNVSGTIPYIIISALFISVLITTTAVIHIRSNYAADITETQYQEIMEIGKTNKEIKPLIVQALSDHKIIVGEYEHIKKISRESTVE